MRQRIESSLALIGLLIAIAVLGVNAWLSYGNTRELSENEASTRHTQAVLTELQSILANVTNAATAQRGFLLSGDADFLTPLDASRAKTMQSAARLQELITDTRMRDRLPGLVKVVEYVFANLDEGIALRRTGRAALDGKPEIIREGKLRVDAVREAIASAEASENELLAERARVSRASLTKNYTMLGVATAVAMATVVLSYLLVRRDHRRRERFAREQDRLAHYNRLLIESTGEGIYGVDLNGNCTFINAAGERILGLKADALLGRNVHSIVHHHRSDGSAYPVEECPISQAFKTGKGCRITDEVFFRPDGKSFPVEYSAYPILNDRKTIEGAVVTFADVTEIRAQQKVARESGERFRAMADNIPQLAWMAEADGAIYWYNQRWFDYTGTKHGENNGWNWQNIHHPDHVERVTEKFARHVANGEEWEDTFPLRGADGTFRWFLSRAVPIRDEKGQVTRWFGTNTDVTVAREIEQSLLASRERIRHVLTEVETAKDEAEHAREQAEAANVAKSQFLANMSHELRTPLNAVIMYSELLQEEAEDLSVPTFIPDLEKIRGAGKHLLALVNGVLDLSKIEAGKMDLYLETFEIPDMVRDVTATVQPLVQKRNNRLEMHVPIGLGPMHADLTKVRQILFNLLSNASKFAEDGTVRLDVTRDTAAGAEWVTFKVSDTGVGMTEEQLGRLFQPFMQADASTTRKYGGTGLGLAISRRFCEMMGGTVDAESEFGKGATFTVRLPTKVTKPLPPEKDEPKQNTVLPAAAVPGTPGKTTVLVIDDESSVRDVVTHALAGDGVRALSAADGEAGLRMARQIQPDLIFLDVMMPKMDGWAVLTALKADPDTADIPVVMLTLMNEAEMGYLLGAAEYLQKPIDRDRLAGVINKYRTSDATDEVLIIEDDNATRDVVKRSLVRQGWNVAEAENGRIGLEQVRRKVPALILLDLMMPEMDGFEFVVELRKEQAWAKIPVVVMTSKDLSPEERAWLTGKVERIVQKGTYSREELLREVRRIAAECTGKPDCVDAVSPSVKTLKPDVDDLALPSPTAAVDGTTDTDRLTNQKEGN